MIRNRDLPMILRNFRQVKIGKDGAPTIDSRELFFVPMRVDGRLLPVYSFDLYYEHSYRKYSTEYVRARDNREAKRKIQRQWPNIIKFQWDDAYER